MSHQIALVIEPVDATHVTATMMMPMGPDMLLKGELADRTISLVGVKDPAAPHPPGACKLPPKRQADRHHAARRRHDQRRDGDEHGTGQVDRRKVEDEEEGLMFLARRRVTGIERYWVLNRWTPEAYCAEAMATADRHQLVDSY